MTTLREAAQAALEALEDCASYTITQERAVINLRAALAQPQSDPLTHVIVDGPDGKDYIARLRKPLYAALAAPDPAAEPVAWELLVDVMSSLAAAISLLERGGKHAKKAAPSDKMFDQMLVDYRGSLERGRSALAEGKP